jgi:pantetheine-phosphate adenylyltransferase
LNKYIPARTKVISIIYDKIQALFDTFVGLPGHNSELVDEKRDFALSYLEQKPYKIGIYPGSFNPFHTGHMSVLTQAEEIFDKVIIAQGINPDKEAPDNPIPNINREVVEYTSLVTELFHYDKNIEYFMVRGLRNEHDMLAEENLRKTIHDINPQIRFTYFCCDPAVEHVSSSMIRGLIKFDENAADRYLITGYNWEPREE